MNQTGFIPNVPENYCFADENFLSETFSVDGFVRRISKRMHSLETLKEQLSGYLKLLKQSMYDLINQDYTEFVNLSANLVGFDKLIQNIKTPVSRLKNETDHSCTMIEQTINSITVKQNRLDSIIKTERKLSLILEMIDYMDRIEANATQIEALSSHCHNLRTKQSNLYAPLIENATLMTRLNMNKNCLKCTSNKFIINLQQRLQMITKQFDSHLERELLYLLNYNQSSLANDQLLCEQLSIALEEIISLFLIDNDHVEKFKQIIQNQIVMPRYQEIIDSSNHQVQTVYSQTLQSIQNEWSVWIHVLVNNRQFDLIIAIIWDPFVESFLVRSPILLDLSDLNSFERIYLATNKFVEQFLQITKLSHYSYRLEQQYSFKRLKSKFKLNVYFHMKLRNLSTQLENNLDQFGFTFNRNSHSLYRLNVSQMIYDQVQECWPKCDNMGHLLVYCWKLTLKIFARFTNWIAAIDTAKINDNQVDNKRLDRQTLIALIFDSYKFLEESSILFTSHIEPLWFDYHKNYLIQRLTSNNDNSIERNSLRHSFDEFVVNFQSKAINKLMTLLRNQIVNECKVWLNQVNDIPRLYRRTNKEKPKEASSYVDKCIAQLIESMQMLNDGHIKSEQLFHDILNDLTVHYKHSTLEVLTSVQKTEDSLKKLKKHKTLQHTAVINTRMSDDDKIRLQIYFDVTTFAQQLNQKLAIDIAAFKSYKELLAIIDSLKLLK